MILGTPERTSCFGIITANEYRYPCDAGFFILQQLCGTQTFSAVDTAKVFSVMYNFDGNRDPAGSDRFQQFTWIRFIKENFR